MLLNKSALCTKEQCCMVFDMIKILFHCSISYIQITWTLPVNKSNMIWTASGEEVHENTCIHKYKRDNGAAHLYAYRNVSGRLPYEPPGSVWAKRYENLILLRYQLCHISQKPAHQAQTSDIFPNLILGKTSERAGRVEMEWKVKYSIIALQEQKLLLRKW